MRPGRPQLGQHNRPVSLYSHSTQGNVVALAPIYAPFYFAYMLNLDLKGGAHLRMLDGHEAAALFALTEKNRPHLRQWLPWLDLNTQPEDTQRFVDGARERYANRESVEAGLFSANQLVGMVSFNTLDWASRCGVIGYWLDADSQGQGLVTRACRALIAHGFDELDLNRIEIRCATGNVRSRAIPERMGFTCEGTLRQVEWLYDHFEDHALYALLRTEWNAAR